MRWALSRVLLAQQAQVCGVAAASTQQLRAATRAGSAGGGSGGADGASAGAQGAASDEGVSELQAALLALAEGRQPPVLEAGPAAEGATGPGGGGGNSARASQSGVGSAAAASIMPDAATAAPFSVRMSDSGTGTASPAGAAAAVGAAAVGGEAAVPSPSGAAGDELVGPYEEVPVSEDPLLYVLRAELYRLTRALAPVVRDIMVRSKCAQGGTWDADGVGVRRGVPVSLRYVWAWARHVAWGRGSCGPATTIWRYGVSLTRAPTISLRSGCRV